MYYTESDCSMSFDNCYSCGKCYLQQTFDLLNMIEQNLEDKHKDEN